MRSLCSPISKPAWLSTPSYTNLLSHHPTLLPLLQNCKSIKHLKQTHAHLYTTGLFHNSYALSALFEFSAISTHGYLDYACKIFRTMDPPTLFTFNTIIRAFSSSQYPEYSICFFLEMLRCGITPNKYTYPFVLKSFSAQLALASGKSVHGHLLKSGSSWDAYVYSSLVHLYCACGAVDDAQRLFDRIPLRNVVCWSSMISGFVQCSQFKRALDLFNEFQNEGVQLNESILVTVLCASAHLGALEQGRWIHAYIARNGVALSVSIGTALINMYCKCGIVDEAFNVFYEMRGRNVLSWTALISGLAMNGMARKALNVFDEMLRTGIKPDSVTLIAVLTACSHGGLVDEAFEHFDGMRKEYQVIPRVEHYGCMVDLLGRVGRLDEALALIKNMPIEPDIVSWGALLNACCVHKNVEMGESVGKLLIELDPFNDASYVLLSNIYAQGMRWTDAIEVRNMMKERGIRKCPGCSVIEVDGIVHEFFKGDKSDPRYEGLRSKLDEMSKRLRMIGYTPSTSEVLLDIDEEEKEQTLCRHSEKLALAFGLINIKSPVPIRIVKNLRACIDCHTATKLVSKIFDREIIVRDRLRFHHFKDGACSCQDYW